MPEADNGGVTVTENSTPIVETDSSKTNNALQPEVLENSGDATTRDCSVQYQTYVCPLGGKNLHKVTFWSFREDAGYVLSTYPISKLIYTCLDLYSFST